MLTKGGRRGPDVSGERQSHRSRGTQREGMLPSLGAAWIESAEPPHWPSWQMAGCPRQSRPDARGEDRVRTSRNALLSYGKTPALPRFRFTGWRLVRQLMSAFQGGRKRMLS